MMTGKSSVLYVVATPIGNLADITARAREILADVDAIACEDTRHSRRLLSHLGIELGARRELIAYHDHNERDVTERLLARLAAGARIALISDAGTPLVSDPGFVLVRAARERGVAVVPVPGPSAPICALSAAGLPSDRFLFLGFPPRAQGQRLAWIGAVAAEPGTLICYESPKRAAATLNDLAAVLGGGRRAVVAREMTKRFETFLSGTLADLAKRVAADPEQQLGELVLLIEGDRRSKEDQSGGEERRILEILAAELPLKQAVALTARITGANRNRLYREALARDRGAG
jgi:16S rRNA (cytidine1402-2'-O)-methyltransferase